MVRKRVSRAENRPNIVVPTIRSPEFFSGFLDDWAEEFGGCHLIVVEDRKHKQLGNILLEHSKKNGYSHELFNHDDIDEDLGKDAWIVPRKTDCVRNYGYLMAYRNNPLFIVTLDDDTKPAVKGHIQQFYNKLFAKPDRESFYFSTMNNVVPRGVLHNFSGTECKLVHGTWLENVDWSAKQQIQYVSNFVAKPEDYYKGYVPFGSLFSMCGMNIAWKPEITKHMYFPLMGHSNGYPIDRCGDIWCGYYVKNKLDEQNKVIYTGDPFVVHKRASNPWTNLLKEQGEEQMGREFIRTFLYGEKPKIQKKYFNKLKEAYKIWEKLIKKVDQG